MSSLDEDPNIAAEKLGLKVVLPGPRDLFIDIDTRDALNKHVSACATLRKNGFTLEEVAFQPSKSGGDHFHVYMRVDHDLDPIERLALQAMRGSDPVRELLGYLRAQRKTRPPTTFFEPLDFVQP